MIEVNSEREFEQIDNKQFEYTNEISDLIINTKLTDLRCKHVCSLESVQAQQVYTETLKTGYDCRWGSVSGNTDCLLI